MNFKQDKFKDIHTEIHRNQILKNERKRENFESSEREVTYHTEAFCIRNQGEKAVVYIFEGINRKKREKKLSVKNFTCSKTVIQNNRGIKTFPGSFTVK